MGEVQPGPFRKVDAAEQFILEVFSRASKPGLLQTNNLIKVVKQLASDKRFASLFQTAKPRKDRECIDLLSHNIQHVLEGTNAEAKQASFAIDAALKGSVLSIARANVAKVAKYAHKQFECFRISQVKIGGEAIPIIKSATAFERWMYRHSSLKTRHEQREAIKQIIGENVQLLSTSTLVQETTKGVEGTPQFAAASRFNQAIEASQEVAGSVAEALRNLRVEAPSTLEANELTAATVQSTGLKTKQLLDFTEPVYRNGLPRYPGDTVNHAIEGAKIFLWTQIRRLGRSVSEAARYFRWGVTAATIRTADAPMRVQADRPSSFWINHSSCLLSGPVTSETKDSAKTFTVLTDPAQEALSKIFYPNETEPGLKPSQFPAVNVMSLSHNHYDHYEEKTVQKLLSMQPVLIVPQGDAVALKLKARGFTNVVEQTWGQETTIPFVSGGKKYTLGFISVPARHWSGRGPSGGQESLFMGHIVTGMEGGPIYIAGDTARLDTDMNGPRPDIGHLDLLRKQGPFQAMYQPGGPDTPRHLMKSTHQASADALWMFKEVHLKGILARGETTKDGFLKAARMCKVLLNHTSTYGLGTLSADDTAMSLRRVIGAFNERYKPDVSKLSRRAQRHLLNIQPWEQEVIDDLKEFRKTLNVIFPVGEKITDEEFGQLLYEVTFVPKIGSRIDFEKDKAAHKGRLQL